METRLAVSCGRVTILRLDPQSVKDRFIAAMAIASYSAEMVKSLS